MNQARKRLVVLISGNGSNLQAIIDACNQDVISADIVAVISNHADVYGLQRAQLADIPSMVLERSQFATRTEYDDALLKQLKSLKPDFVILAGFMHILSDELVETFLGRMVNIHPSLLPKYPGLHTHRQVIENHDHEHGCSVHFVTADLDAGPLIAQMRLKVDPKDDETTLKNRVHQLEHQIYPQIIQWLCADRLRLRAQGPCLDENVLPKNGLNLRANSLTIC